MSSGSTVTFAQGVDWCGIYLDGKLLSQGHSMDGDDLERLIKELGHWAHTRPVDDEWLVNRGGLPTNMNEVHWK